MKLLNPAMRLKVKKDTFFIPDGNGGVYFRNNQVSFLMEGKMVEQWIEHLLPMFNGEHSLEELTNGLQDHYKKQIYDIAAALYNNGFVRDLSEDRPHHLNDALLQRFGSQIEFLDSLGHSGAYRFQTYRQAKVLAIGCGPIFVALAAALLQSGLPQFHMLVTDVDITNLQRILELENYARQSDPEVKLSLTFPERMLSGDNQVDWRQAVQPFDYIMYVSQQENVELMRTVHAICREERKVLLPAHILLHAGLAGPVVHPQSDGCWESVMRRIHLSSLHKVQSPESFSSTAGAIIANVIVFELLKFAAGVTGVEQSRMFYLLDPETLEGNWHSFQPHPLVSGLPSARKIQLDDLLPVQKIEKVSSSAWLPYFGKITSKICGIFHIWDEEDLAQLPLSLCRIQVADPLSEPHAQLLPAVICAGLTHEEARREAALSGIETYAARLTGCKDMGVDMGVGAGLSIAEAVCRGLQHYLTVHLERRQLAHEVIIAPLELEKVEDERCRFYMHALTTMQEEPLIGLGEDIFGFPVVWAGTSSHWYGNAGLNMTLALRGALQQALLMKQSDAAIPAKQSASPDAPLLHILQHSPVKTTIFASHESDDIPLMEEAIRVLNRNKKQLILYDLALEPFLQEQLAAVFGVELEEGEAV